MSPLSFDYIVSISSNSSLRDLGESLRLTKTLWLIGTPIHPFPETIHSSFSLSESPWGKEVVLGTTTSINIRIITENGKNGNKGIKEKEKGK